MEGTLGGHLIQLSSHRRVAPNPSLSLCPFTGISAVSLYLSCIGEPITRHSTIPVPNRGKGLPP